jgi:GMP synthase (glutamine-hydrolysing)
MKPVLVVRHVPHEGPGTVADALRAAGLTWRTADMFARRPARELLPAATAGLPLPQDFEPDDWAGLVVMGGPMNVDETDRHPHLADEVAWLRRAVAAELPVLGICLGAQLLAKALGARIHRNAVKELGWGEIELTGRAAGDSLLGTCRPREMAFHWHGDTFTPPPGSIHLARTADCAQQAFRYGPAAYGLQFHWEVTPAMLDCWLAEPGMCRELASLPGGAAEIRRRAAAEFFGMQRLARTVFGRFAELCAGRPADEERR